MTTNRIVKSTLAAVLTLALLPLGHAQQARDTLVRNEQVATTVNICALMRPQAGKADELRQALLALVTPTSKEEGFMTYNLYEEKDGAIFLHEVWRSQQDLERHFDKPYVKDFVSRTSSLLDGPNEAHFGKVVSTLNNPRFSARDAQVPTAVNICSVKRPLAGKAEELRRALLALVEPTSKEEGFITYNLYEEEDGALFLYEAWRSRADLDAHFQQPYIRDFQRKVGSLTERNDVRFGKYIPVTAK